MDMTVCDKCGCELNMVAASRTIPVLVCHNCGGFMYDQEIVGVYDHDVIYGNGVRTHLFLIKPFWCSTCGKMFLGHEMYCGLLPEDGYEALETLAISTHYRLQKKWEEME